MAVSYGEHCRKSAAGCNIKAVWEEVPADLETPISVFKKTAAGEYTYLLESVEGGERIARYSIIGFDPLVIFRAKGDAVEIEDAGGKRTVRGDPLGALKELMSGLRVGPLPGEPRFFGGAVGYFGYDLVRHFERIPELATDDLGLPDCFFIITRNVLIYDHVRRTLKIVAFEPEEGGRAEAEIRRIKERLLAELPGEQAERRPPASQGPVSNMSRERFVEGVRRAKEYIKAGDIFQVVLSQRFRQEVNADPFSVYRVLRTLNPSPYMFYLNFGDLRIVGSSPEMLVRVEDGRVETHPIAGTRPRGETPEADEALAREMQADPKERAEHVMLVDLGRNDLGRVCEYGSVRVVRFMENERYSHVMHLVSVVRGRLARGSDAFDALRACFPAGTVSGAPKVRAMEIIEELEPTRRGPYAGAIGYLSFNGNLDSCIAIRTIVMQGNTAYVQAGAGIVADSDPEREYEETLNKAGALLKALSLAEEGEGA
ncbi:MAG TPA: anthranilate synthase component I [Syntrophomonadaceae bacterium]|nr:anthranilate synthase component I [Syntrophomonadaceae bacterium]